MTTVLGVAGLRKEYAVGRDRRVVAVGEVSFGLDAGRCLAIVGESGSGKTTTARMLAGLERPTAGTVRLDELDASVPARRARDRRLRGRRLQIVFQDPYVSLDPRQSPRAAIDEILRLHTDLDRRRRRDRGAELGASVGLGGQQLDAPPSALSGGQRQRVAIAKALAAEPSVIVLDEAVSALDVSIQAQILNLLADVRAATGTAYVFITHDLAVVRQVADDVLVMERGVVVERGTVTEVLDSPSHPYTRRLRAAVPPRAFAASRRALTSLDGA